MKKVFPFILILNFLFADLLKPENATNLSTIHILFEWEQEPNAIGYNIQISGDEVFENILLDINQHSTLYIEKNIIDWSNTYFWRVRPIYIGNSYGEWINQSTFSTSSSILQNFDVNIYDSESLQDGLIIFGQFAPSLLIGVIDELGNEIWNSRGDELEDALVALLNYVSKSGQLFGKRGSNAINFNSNKEILWSSPNNTEIDLHETQQLPNDNYMCFLPVSELGPIVPDDRWTELFQNLGYVVDGETIEFPWLAQRIVEWDKDTGEEVWSWNPFDYLSIDEHDVGAELWEDAYVKGRFDWLHSNSFHFDPIESVIYISHRHLNRICKIAYPSGEVLWNMGLPEEYNMGNNNICTNLRFSWQHHVQLLEDGDLLFFDNGNLSELVMDDPYRTSRVRRIRVNEDYTCDTIWQYELPEHLFAPGTGSVQLLNNGNYSIYTLGGYDDCSILEVTPDKELIWIAEASDSTSSLYRTYKIPSIYPEAFSVKAENFITDNNNNNIIQIEDNQIHFIIYNHSGYTQDYSYSFLDSNTYPNNIFANMDGEFSLNSNESTTLSFDVINSEINTTEIILNVVPIDHQYAQKQLTFIVSNLNLNNSISIDEFELTNIYPNPFNPTTTIGYNISQISNIKISIYNTNGQLVEILTDKIHQPGTYNINWDATEYTSGAYFVKLITEDFIDTQKIMLIK